MFSERIPHSSVELGANLASDLKARLIFRPTLSKLREQAAMAPRIKEIPPFEDIASAPHNASTIISAKAYGLLPTDLEAIRLEEHVHADLINRVLSLEAASQPEINRYNKQQVMDYFARVPNDTGSPEVQGFSINDINLLIFFSGNHFSSTGLSCTTCILS